MNNSLSIYSTSEAAIKLGVSKKTLMRWDEDGKFPAKRDRNNFRTYNKKVVDDHIPWFSLRREHKKHLRKLKPIRVKADSFTRTRPLNSDNPPRRFDYRNMKKAYESLKEWEDKEREIVKKYSNLPKRFRPLVSPES